MKKAGEGGRETHERREDTYKYTEREGEVGHTLRVGRVYTLRKGKGDTLESWEGVNTEIW